MEVPTRQLFDLPSGATGIHEPASNLTVRNILQFPINHSFKIYYCQQKCLIEMRHAIRAPTREFDCFRGSIPLYIYITIRFRNISARFTILPVLNTNFLLSHCLNENQL